MYKYNAFCVANDFRKNEKGKSVVVLNIRTTSVLGSNEPVIKNFFYQMYPNSSGAALKFTDKVLFGVFGFNGEFNDLHTNRNLLSDIECTIDTEEEEYNGKTVERIRYINEPKNYSNWSDGEQNDEEIKAASDALSGELAIVRAKRDFKPAKVVKRELPPDNNPDSNSDLPF